ncbi:hypothetical protein SAMN05444413_102381 [Roseivivax marinus]|uniref:DUF1285 domain-containing protein n=1 Tax=Roseivivax marinus TaxID=1379903 RepID=UPI0008C91384|nr:DUF1285 domain-containing protein [Roseivivax marinus]SEK62461.1 hypothetical protein SAMN05444413_102381 [Roseivivax marinus]
MSSQNSVTPSPDGIAASVRAHAGKGLPPVDKWTPDLSGTMDIRIARDGTWYHEGGPIRRAGLVKLFSSILKREGDAYFLVTPVEKWRIQVEDAPFVATDVEIEGAGDGQALTFTTHVGDRVVAGPDHAIRVTRDPETGEPSPYVHVRGGLEALIDRKTFYRLAEVGEVAEREGSDWFGVWSDGAFFAMIPADEMPD